VYRRVVVVLIEWMSRKVGDLPDEQLGDTLEETGKCSMPSRYLVGLVSSLFARLPVLAA
jgi:hypothetical protein